MMQIIMTLSEKCRISPFEILNQNFDDFALLVNYYIEGQEQTARAEEVKPKHSGNGKNRRVRVNDMTATGGWF